jgi:HPr kinase/phosphorylase
VSRNIPRRPDPYTLHATSVAIDGAAIVITGASGRGKSGLALDLIAFGARLISDDITRIEPGEDGLPWAVSTGRMTGVIEAWGVGLLRVPHVGRAPVRLLVDLDRTETARHPEPVTQVVLGQGIPAVARVDSPHFAASILALSKGGRVE